MFEAQVLALAILVCSIEHAAIAGTEASYRAVVQARNAEVITRVAGRIARVVVHDGQTVVPGAPVIVLDDHELRARVTAARAELATRQGQLQAAKTARERAHPPERDEELAAEVDLANARMLHAQATLDLAQLDLTHATITAEIHGAITLHAATPGQLVQRTQSLATITDLDDVWVDAYFTEPQVAHIAVDQRADVEIAVLDRNKKLVQGKVEEVDLEGAQLVHTVVDGTQARVGVRVKVRLVETIGDWAQRPDLTTSVVVHTP
jgi:RND family efflux transporter MFP subunit